MGTFQAQGFTGPRGSGERKNGKQVDTLGGMNITLFRKAFGLFPTRKTAYTQLSSENDPVLPSTILVGR